MKINPNNKAHQLSGQAVQTPEKMQGKDAFDSVLKETIQSSGVTPVNKESPIQPLVRPYPSMGGGADSNAAASAVAHKLLDTLEAYQQMLADPSASLRMIQPSVDQMKAQVTTSEAILKNMPDGNPVKTILESAIMNISQEVDKFNSGYYVDEQFVG